MPECDLCGRFSLTGNICSLCQLKRPVDQLIQAASINLQMNTVDDMIDRFVIENHQAKHYAGAGPT